MRDAKALADDIISPSGAMGGVADLLNIWAAFVPSNTVRLFVLRSLTSSPASARTILRYLALRLACIVPGRNYALSTWSIPNGRGRRVDSSEKGKKQDATKPSS